MNGPEIIVTSDVASISHDVADRLVQIAKEIIAERGRFTFCLSGGSTPKSLFELMASDAYRNKFDWDHVHVFWGDERSVPPDHADSNYRMANEAMLSKVPIPKANVHRMEAEAADLPGAAAAYETMLRSFFGDLPNFDVLLLGMGPDGHTASLFPGSQALTEQQKWCVPNWVEKFNTWRMTLTYPVLNHSERVFFLAGGKDKADVLKTVLEDTHKVTYPCQGVKPDHGVLVWFIDMAAAARLTVPSA
jgi:6-phosphogluconolactonase